MFTRTLSRRLRPEAGVNIDRGYVDWSQKSAAVTVSYARFTVTAALALHSLAGIALLTYLSIAAGDEWVDPVRYYLVTVTTALTTGATVISVWSHLFTEERNAEKFVGMEPVPFFGKVIRVDREAGGEAETVRWDMPEDVAAHAGAVSAVLSDPDHALAAAMHRELGGLARARTERQTAKRASELRDLTLLAAGKRVSS